MKYLVILSCLVLTACDSYQPHKLCNGQVVQTSPYTLIIQCTNGQSIEVHSTKYSLTISNI